jgi:hypothetical protein
MGSSFKEQFHKAKRYTDFRELLTKEKSIDAVVIATPDHLHAVIAKAAMDLGQARLCTKAAAATVHEARVLRQSALAQSKARDADGKSGAFERRRAAHQRMDPGGTHWPRARGARLDQSADRVLAAGAATPDRRDATRYGQSLRQSLDLPSCAGCARRRNGQWRHSPCEPRLGPLSRVRGRECPYHPIYHPFNWRGWLDFGSGALGDMGAHLLDHPFWALGLTYPTSVEATSTPWGTMALPPLDPTAPANTPAGRPQRRPVSFPLSTSVHYHFGARGAQPPVKLSWSDGGIYPPRPDALPGDVELTSEGGVIFIGEKGILLHGTYGDNPRLYPQSLGAGGHGAQKHSARPVEP